MLYGACDRERLLSNLTDLHGRAARLSLCRRPSRSAIFEPSARWLSAGYSSILYTGFAAAAVRVSCPAAAV
jgi:hypothetical protein